MGFHLNEFNRVEPITRWCVVSTSLGRSILSKVQKMFVPGCFPIHMDPRTSPSEKNSKKIDTSYWSKQAEVLLYDVVYSDFSPIT